MSSLSLRATIYLFSIAFKMQGAWRSHPSHANEAMDVDWMGSQTCEPVPANEIGMGDCYSQLAISGFYSFCVHPDITNYHQKMERIPKQ